MPGLAIAGRTLVVLAVLLPAADYFFRRSELEVAAAAPVEPVYSFRAAKGNPAAFSAWWIYYANEWVRPNGGWHSIQMPDRKGILRFVMMPNSTTRFFDSVIRMNNFGFRGADIEFDKGDRYRIFALGESSTFGATIRPDDRPWPDVLATMIKSRLRCDRPIEVINAGTGGYDLEANIERVRRDIIPLQPDLVLSYHGYNGMRFLDIDPTAEELQQAPRRGDGPSALIEEVLYRAKLYRWKKSPVPAQTFSEDEVLRSRYAELYRELIRLGGRTISRSCWPISAWRSCRCRRGRWSSFMDWVFPNRRERDGSHYCPQLHDRQDRDPGECSRYRRDAESRGSLGRRPLSRPGPLYSKGT